MKMKQFTQPPVVKNEENGTTLDNKSPARIDSSKVTNMVESLLLQSSESIDLINIEKIFTWVKSAESEERITFIQKQISNFLRKQNNLNIPIMVLLNKIQSYSESTLNIQEFTAQIEHSNINPIVFDKISEIAQKNDKKENQILHQVLDFFEYHIKSIQNFTPEDVSVYNVARSNFTVEFSDFAEDQSKTAQNYLISQHLKDIGESIYGDNKPGTVSGTSGGSTDKTIYTFQKLRESYDFRMAMGIKEGWPIVNPVLPIGPGYAGYYNDGKLVKIYESNKSNEDIKAKAKEKSDKYIKQNDPQYDYIYDKLNRELIFHSGGNHSSRQLNKLRDIWEFKDSLKKDKKTFFYDLSRIDTNQLHPMVYGDILTQNEKYIDEIEGKKNEIVPIDENSYNKLLFYGEKVNDEQKYIYHYLIGLSMRKKIEDDFQTNLADLNMHSQVQFLNFLNKSNIEEVLRLKAILKENQPIKKEIMNSFLACGEDPAYSKVIFSLAEKLPKKTAEKVFVKYGEIIDVANKAEEEIKILYGKGNIPEGVSSSVQEVLLKRGAKFLSELGDRANSINEQEVLQELENIKTETMILGSSYLELYKTGEKIPFDEIKGTTVEKISAQNLTKEKKKEIIEAYRKGRPKETYENEEHLKLLTSEFGENLNKKETFVFNIRFKGEIIAFATFQKENEDTFHIGGLTFLEDVRNPVVAEAVMNSIMKEFGKYNITAEVHSKNKILNMYQKRFGFKVVEEMPLDENAGELYYKIERPKDLKIEEKQELEMAA